MDVWTSAFCPYVHARFERVGPFPRRISGISPCSTGRNRSIFSQPHGNGDTKQETTHAIRLSRKKALAGASAFYYPVTFYTLRNQPQQTVVDAFGEAHGEGIDEFVAQFFLGQSFVVFEEA